MAAKDFTEYVLDKANDIIDLNEEIAIELENLTGTVDEFVNEAVAAYRDQILNLIAAQDDII
jgi:heme oxygenase